MAENKTILRLKHKVSADLYTLLTTGRVLFLTLNRNWYVKIASGEKKEEYRELKDYWLKRLLYKIEVPFGGYWCAAKDISEGDYSCKNWKDFTGGAPVFNEYDLIVFQNGYGDAPTTIVDSNGIEIKTGREDWGALAEQFYLTLKLGEIRYSEPCS